MDICILFEYAWIACMLPGWKLFKGWMTRQSILQRFVQWIMRNAIDYEFINSLILIKCLNLKSKPDAGNNLGHTFLNLAILFWWDDMTRNNQCSRDPSRMKSKSSLKSWWSRNNDLLDSSYGRECVSVDMKRLFLKIDGSEPIELKSNSSGFSCFFLSLRKITQKEPLFAKVVQTFLKCQKPLWKMILYCTLKGSILKKLNFFSRKC